MSTQKRNAAWLFEDWPEGSLFRLSQVLATALTRLWVVTVYRPVRRWLR